MCTSAKTQLDSLLYPRDERSATWALPPAVTWHPLERVNHVHLYTLPHNNAAEWLQTAGPIHTLFSQPSTEFTFVSHWQMVFRFLAKLTTSHRYGFLDCRPHFLPG